LARAAGRHARGGCVGHRRRRRAQGRRHTSTSNLSPWHRVSVYLSLCAVSNHIRRFKRPGYIAHRDFTPIECLPDDCLLREYDVALPWKNGTPPGEQRGLTEVA
jgi:ectoine hydroxylase